MSRVVFVGNVPYNMGEDQLVEVFKTVGHVVGFRLVYDRESSKPRGYGFCEFADHETAQSAVRNLNGHDVGGRPLRIDLADSDPFLEGRSTNRGELLDTYESRSYDILANLPPGVPVPLGKTSLDVITHALTSIRPSQVLDVLAQMKTYVTNYPTQATYLLSHNPQLAFALFQALILNDVVDRSVIDRMQAAANAAIAPPAPPQQPPQQAHVQSQMAHAPQQHMASYGHYPGMSPSMNMPGIMPQAPPAYMPTAAPQHVMPQAAPGLGQTHMWNRPAPPPQAPTPTVPAPETHSAEQQRSMLLQVLQLTPDQINALPPGERAVVEQLRQQLYGAIQRPTT